MKASLIDISSLHAVESLFRKGQSDPWAARLAGDLVDLAIYSDEVRYPLPAASVTPELRTGPALLIELARRDSAVYAPKPYSTDNPRTVADDHLEDCLAQFAGWCRSNPVKAQQWVTMHQESWISNWHNEHIPHTYVFDVRKVGERFDVQQRAAAAGLTVEGFLYALDVVLRYPMYGELAGDGCSYLNHPIRDAVTHPTLEQDPSPKPVGAITFAKTFAALAPKLTQDEYTVLIHELRGTVRDMGLHRVKPGQVEKEVVRELAAKVALPPHLGEAERKMTMWSGVIGGVGAGVIGIVGAAPVLAVAGPVLGTAVSIAQYYWAGGVPRSAARIKWLRWALQWDLETQAQG